MKRGNKMVYCQGSAPLNQLQEEQTPAGFIRQHQSGMKAQHKLSAVSSCENASMLYDAVTLITAWPAKQGHRDPSLSQGPAETD